ncbi:MAG: murein biosynthesis integral membrane protein MurJ [Candidatus Babeliales bacterium]|jgi:putative peptidoglycan lipid II flippase
MNLQLSKKSILKKTALVSGLTLLSKTLGVIREILVVRFLGVGAISDAFLAAFRLPNFFRLIFAEGAMSASFVPAMVKTVREGNSEEANGLMTISFLFFESIVLLIYLFVLLRADWVLLLLAPGFSPEQVSYARPFLRILFSFLFFISSSALLAGALNSVNHFFVPAFGTPLWNLFYITTLVLCLWYKLPVTVLCYGIIVGALALFVMHLVAFFKCGFSFGSITVGVRAAFKSVLAKFLPCLFGVSIVELNLFISCSIASFLPVGSMTLLNYGSRFVSIPLGMFAVALSSVMLSHFSRLVLYAPRRLNFYLLEVAKFVTWVILPAMLFTAFVAHDLFVVLLGDKATPAQIAQGGWVLTFYCTGLLFLCINKILLSMFYALKDTIATTIAAAMCAIINIAGDLISLKFFGVYGIAVSNSISACVMTALLFAFLYRRHKIAFYFGRYVQFFMRYALQLLLGCLIFGIVLLCLTQLCNIFGFACMLRHGLWFLLLTSMVMAIVVFLSYTTRRRFGIDLYFLKK